MGSSQGQEPVISTSPSIKDVHIIDGVLFEMYIAV